MTLPDHHDEMSSTLQAIREERANLATNPGRYAEETWALYEDLAQELSRPVPDEEVVQDMISRSAALDAREAEEGWR